MFGSRILKVMFLLLALIGLSPLAATNAQSAGQKYTRPIAFVRADGIYITDTAGSQPTRVIAPVQPDKANHNFGRPRWSPDGQHIVASDYAYQDTGGSTTSLVRVTSQDKQRPLYTMKTRYLNERYPNSLDAERHAHCGI